MSLLGHAVQFQYEGTLTIASVANSTSAWPEQEVTLPTGYTFPTPGGTNGLNGGILHLALPDLQTGLAFCNLFQSASNKFKLRFFNATGGALTPTATNARLVMF